RLQARILACEAVLVVLAAAQEAVLALAVRERFADRVAGQERPGPEPAPGEVTADLEVRVDRAEAEAVPDGCGRSLELEEPEPEPAAPVRRPRELAVERLPAGELGAGPACLVQPEEDVEVAVEPRRIVREPEDEP